MKLATGILVLGIGLGTAWGQNPSIIDSTKAKLNTVQQQKTADSNAALAAAQGQSTSAPASNAKSGATVAKPAAAKAATTASKPMITASGNQPQASVKQQVGSAVQKSALVASKAQPAGSAAMGPKAVAATAAIKAGAPAVKAAQAKADPTKPAAAKHVKTTKVAVPKSAQEKPAVAVEDKQNPDPKKDTKKTISMAGGRRDPFLSPVVNRGVGGSGCSTGKRCLAVDQIALTGIVKSEGGMIAVVVNALNKAYFLRENDPVFNGFVVKITPDSIIFKETMQDKLGKSFTREVTKKISTPAV